jgi:hypothetical protein
VRYENETAVMEERVSTTKKKKRIIELLLQGESPGAAAQAVKTTRQQAYLWRDKDPVFADKWADAVATGLDVLESSIMKRALDGSDAMATLILKCRRPEVYNPQVVERHIIDERNANRPVTLQEALAEMMRLGLPIPALECDYVEIESSVTSSKSDDDPV